MLVRKYVDRNGLAAMLAAKRLAGITPQVNLGIPLHADNKACKRGIHPDFEIQGRRQQNSKTDLETDTYKYEKCFHHL